MEQSNTGLPEFKIANLFEDIEMLKGVQSIAIKIIHKDNRLENAENEKLKQQIEDKFSKKIQM